MASTCIPKKRLRSAKLFSLDDCGRIQQAGLTVLDWLGFESVTWKDDIEPGERELITGVDGKPCVDDTSCPIDRGDMFTLTECTENITLMALTGFGSLTATLGVTDGFDRLPYDCTAIAALELVFDTPTVCDADGTPQCVAMLVPLLENWSSTGTDKTVNGKTTVRGGYTAETKRNARLFESFYDDVEEEYVITGELAHWQPWADAIATGTQWYLQRVIDCPTPTPKSCEARILNIGGG